MSDTTDLEQRQRQMIVDAALNPDTVIEQMSVDPGELFTIVNVQLRVQP